MRKLGLWIMNVRFLKIISQIFAVDIYLSPTPANYPSSGKIAPSSSGLILAGSDSKCKILGAKISYRVLLSLSKNLDSSGLVWLHDHQGTRFLLPICCYSFHFMTLAISGPTKTPLFQVAGRKKEACPSS